MELTSCIPGIELQLQPRDSSCYSSHSFHPYSSHSFHPYSSQQAIPGIPDSNDPYCSYPKKLLHTKIENENYETNEKNEDKIYKSKFRKI